MKAFVDGIGLLAPGISSWSAARSVLSGMAPYSGGEMARPSADLLPPIERRRCGEPAKLALHVGVEALVQSGARADAVPTVFTSSSGNGEVLHQICGTLATAERELSPTRFHNSVHNAPAGYWSIATGSREPSVSLCAYQGSFAAGLVEAALQASAEQRPVLLIACDTVHPEPLHTVCPVIAPFAVAVLLGAAASRASCAAIELTLGRNGEATRLADRALEALRQGNAAARSLPLLAAIAAQRRGTVTIEYLPQLSLAAVVEPFQ